jgi:hypothetical protein
MHVLSATDFLVTLAKSGYHNTGQPRSILPDTATNAWHSEGRDR